MTGVASEALAYQSPIVQVREEPVPWLLRLWPALGAALLVGLVGLGAVLPVDVVVAAQGRIASDDPPAVLRPVGAAVLHSLLVRPGDVVAEGQLLARLDSRAPDMDVAVLRTARAALTAQVARIEAELEGRRIEGGTPELDLQLRVQTERAATAAAQREGLLADLARAEGAIVAETAEAPAIAEWLLAASELEDMRRDLLSGQNGTRAAFVEAQLTRLEAEEGERRHAARLDALGKERETAAARLAAFDSELRQERLEELAELRPQLAMVEEQLDQATGLARMYDIVAPHAGVVLSVAPGGPGSLITTADPVAVIAPLGGPIHVEIELRSGDVGLVHPGDRVQVKVDAFPWRRHGLIEGRLTDIAPSSAPPAAGTTETGMGALHAARVALAPDGPRPDGLMPGMTLTTDVIIGTRSILEFFLGPLLDGLSQSLREPRP